MEDKVLAETDIHWIVKIFQKSSSLILNKDLVCGALGLTLAEIEEIDRRIDRDRSSTYKYFSLVVSKWIEKNSDRATLSKLAVILRHEEFSSTADELLRTVDSSPKTNTANDDQGNGATTAKEFDRVKIPKSSVNKVQNISTTGKCKLPHQSAEDQIKPPPIPPNLKAKAYEMDQDFNTMNLDSKETGSYAAKKPPNPSPVERIKTTMSPIPLPLPTSPPNAANSLRGNENQLNITGEDQIVKRIGNEPFQSQNAKPGQTEGKSTDLNRKSSKIGMTQIKISGEVQKSGFLNWLRKDNIAHRAQTEFNKFLKSAPEKFSTLKMIELDNIEMNWCAFWNSIDHIKTVESIGLINMTINGFIPPRKILLPNLRDYVLELDNDSSGSILSASKQARGTSAEVKYLVEYLIPFVKDNLGEDIWSTCLSLEYVRLDLVVSSKKVTFSIDKDNFEFHVDRIHVEYLQKSNGTQYNILPKFLQSFQGLKKLTLINRRGISGYIDFSSIPNYLTHLRLLDSPTSIRDGDLDVVLKTCRELVYLSMGDPIFSTIIRHTLDLANLSPKIRYLHLYNTSITCSSHCEFNHLGVLCLYDSHFESSVNVPFIFRNIKKCYFQRSSRWSDPPFTGLKKWLEMDLLELIAIEALRIDQGDGVGEILSTYGVPPNSEEFSLERNGKKQWQFVKTENDPWDIIDQALTQGWKYTVK